MPCEQTIQGAIVAAACMGMVTNSRNLVMSPMNTALRVAQRHSTQNQIKNYGCLDLCQSMLLYFLKRQCIGSSFLVCPPMW